MFQYMTNSFDEKRDAIQKSLFNIEINSNRRDFMSFEHLAGKVERGCPIVKQNFNLFRDEY